MCSNHGRLCASDILIIYVCRYNILDLSPYGNSSKMEPKIIDQSKPVAVISTYAYLYFLYWALSIMSIS